MKNSIDTEAVFSLLKMASEYNELGRTDVAQHFLRIAIDYVRNPDGPEEHLDDIFVDHFAAAMKEKLAQARAKGRGGWETCSRNDLSLLLREHVEKGDPLDVANFCMFLWTLGHGIAVTGESKADSFSMMPKGYAEHRAGFVNTPKGEEPASFVDVHSAADEARARVASTKEQS